MTLTYGKAPFSEVPGGVFNFRRQGPPEVLYWEDFPKRVRVEFNHETIADSRKVKALHEKPGNSWPSTSLARTWRCAISSPATIASSSAQGYRRLLVGEGRRPHCGGRCLVL